MIDETRKEELIDQGFRNKIATIDEKGKRNYLFPKKPKGALYNKRTIFSIVYLILFLVIPWIKIEGEPLIMMNILKRKFIIFGQIFGPQDFFIFALGMLTFVVFIILFTVIFGRVFCGWACPQTIFMEMVFRKIEYWIEGDYTKQQHLKAMPWNSYKIRKKTTKIFIFYAVSFILANYFMAYIISMDEVIRYVYEGISSHLSTFFSIIGFTTVFFFVYYWFREQVCIVVCPYGRLQGVLLDKNSIVVAYDYIRGEPRGKKASAENQLGDCIDCKACVRVCPTGIDIRNGTQLECINCTACIDSCDEIMENIGKPKNLIRFASENNIVKNQKLKFNTRIKAYSVVLIVIASALGSMLLTRDDVDITILRTQGMIYQTLPNGYIGNLYSARMFNETHKDITLSLGIDEKEGSIEVLGKQPTINKESYAVLTFLIKKKSELITKRKSDIKVNFYIDKIKIASKKTSFIGPVGS